MPFDLLDLVLTGMQESFSPPLMAIAGVLGLACLCLRPSGKDALCARVADFCVTLVLCRVVFDSGVANVFVLVPKFLVVAVWAYLVLGSIFLVTGLAFLYERMALIRNGALLFAGFVRGVKLTKGVVSILAVGLGAAAAFWINAWPLSYQATIAGSLLRTANGLFNAFWVLVVYEIVRNLGSLLTGGIFLLSLSGKPAEVFNAHKTLVAVMMSAAYLAVGGSLVAFCCMVHVGP